MEKKSRGRSPRACMEICWSGPVRLSELKGAPSGMMVCPTRSLGRLPLRSLAPSHIRRQPDDTSLCGRHLRIPVILSLAQQRPSHACHTVGQRNRDQHIRLSGKPGAFGRAFAHCPSHHGDGTDDQQSTNVALAHLRCAAQPVLAADRMLSRREADRSGEVPTLRAGLHPRREGGDRRCGHRSQPPQGLAHPLELPRMGIAPDLARQTRREPRVTLAKRQVRFLSERTRRRRAFS